MLSITLAEAWAPLFGPDALRPDGGRLDDLKAEAPFRLVTPAGDVFAGEVRKLVAGKTFSAMVETLNKAMLTVELAGVPGHGNFLYLALTTWGLPRDEVEALDGRLRGLVRGLFPQSPYDTASGCAAALPAESASE